MSNDSQILIIRSFVVLSSSDTSPISSRHVDEVYDYLRATWIVFFKKRNRRRDSDWSCLHAKTNSASDLCPTSGRPSPFFVIQWNISRKLIDDNMEINYKSLLNTFKISFHWNFLKYISRCYSRGGGGFLFFFLAILSSIFKISFLWRFFK